MTDDHDAARREASLAAENVDRIRARASYNEDGDYVYRTLDGSASYTDDGIPLTPGQQSRIHWEPSNPTWEERLAAGQREQQARDTLTVLDQQRLSSSWTRAGRQPEPPSPLPIPMLRTPKP